MAKAGTFEYGIKLNLDKSGLVELTNSLNQIQKLTGSDLMKLDKSLNINQAVEKVMQLKQTAETVRNALEKSFNVKLNSTNLTAFNKELSKSGLSIQNIYRQFNEAGQAGSSAFRKLTTDLLTTNLELKESNTLLDKMAETMGNTIKWGISSSVFNKITSSIQNAYNYTLKLDKSLNSIRIVSNASADDMERFAKYANEAAKNLGSSTLDYTKGALIYYQQGLSEQEVKKRTDVTLKMANVLGSSSEEVSNYMTAIWNNFAEGSSNLEHFADVITKLGAETASSSEEIATGLEKFAAVSKTVGLSYEYATSALATVVAQTRQSADVVGTAFKTLFSRIQGLSLGETLDDGVTLTKYSAALEKIGVNIKDASGNLKSMDSILDEMGAKWQTLTDAQKVATAQTVAGVRQYTQLVALMDNWDKFSQNLERANTATGSLQKQQDIYMDSAEAHLQRLQTAYEGLYDSIFDENSIKDVADILTVLVERLSSFVQSLGGGGNTLLALGSTALRVFDDQIGRSLAGTISNLKKANANVTELTAQMKLLEEIQGLDETSEYFKDLVTWKKEILDMGNLVTAEQHNEANAIIKQRAELEENKEAWEANLQAASDYFARMGNPVENGKVVDTSVSGLKEVNDIGVLDSYNDVIDKTIKKSETYIKTVEDLNRAEQKRIQINAQKGSAAKETETAMNVEAEAIKRLKNVINELLGSETLLPEQAKKLNDALEAYTNAMSGEDIEAQAIALENLKNTFSKVNKQIIEDSQKTKQTLTGQVEGMTQKFDDAEKEIEGFWASFKHNLKMGETIKNFVNIAGAAGQVASALSSLNHISDILNNKDLSGGEKAIQIVTALGTALPMLVSGVKALWVALTASPWGLILAGLVAIGAAIYAHATALSKEEAELQRTQKAVKEAQEAYDELKSTVDSYSDARKGIDSLTEGTVEFYEAVIKSNEEAQKLIDKLHLMIGEDYTIGKDGVITIKEEALTQSLYEQMQEVYRRQSQQYTAQAALVEKDQLSVIESFRKEVNRLGKEQGSNLGFNEAKNLLTGNGVINTQLDEIKSSVDKNTVEIGSAITTYLPRYLGNQTTIQGYNRQAAIEALRGFGTENQNKQLSSQTSLAQNYIADILNKGLKTTKVNAEEFSFGRALSLYGSNVLSSSLRGGGPGSIISGAWNTGRDLANDKAVVDDIKSRYLQATKGWNASNGTWTTKNGTIIDNKTIEDELKNVDFGTAKAAYESGRLWTSEDYDKAGIGRTIDTIAGAGFNETSRRRVTEMMLALQAGAGDVDLANISKTLSNEEKQYISNNIKQGYSQSIQFFSDGSQQKEEYSGLMFNGSQIAASQENLDKYLALSKDLEPTQERLNLLAKEYNETIEDQASKLGISAETLDFFRIAAQGAGKVQKGLSVETASAAAEQYKFNKKYNEAVSVYYDNKEAIQAYGKALKNNQEISYDLADAMGELSKSLKDMGLSLNAETITKHLSEVEKLLTGTKKQAEEAYKVLYDLSRIDVLESFFGTGEELLKQYQEIIKAIDETTPGTVMAENYANKLAEMIENTQLTVDQINDLASKLGITIPVTYNVPEELTIQDKELTTKATSTLHRYTGEMPNPGYRNEGDPKTIPINYSWVETVEDKTDHFLVPDKTNFTVNTNKQNIGSKINLSRSQANQKKASGGGSSSKPKHIDPLEEQADRYHKINTQITKVDNALKKLQSQQEKFVGAKLIDNLNKQWNLLNTQINNYNEKLRIANQEQQELNNKLRAQGVQFNPDGTIANYMESFQAQEKYVNNLINQYNSLSKKQQEAWDNNKTIENAKENFNKFKENLDRYDELVSNFIPDLQQSIQDVVDKQIELNIQKFNMEIKITLDMNQATRDWNEWKKRAIDGIETDDILGNARARFLDFNTYFRTDGAGDIQAATEQVNKTLQELYKMDKLGDNVFGNNRAKALENLSTDFNNLKQSVSGLIQLQDELYQSVLDEMDAVQTRFSRQIKDYEYLRNIINHDIKIIQLAYGDESYNTLTKFYQRQQENYAAQLDFQRQQKDFWYEQMQLAEENTKEWLSAYEKWQEAVNNFNSIFEASLENARAKFENVLNDIFQKLNNKVTNNMGLDYVNTQWELINKNTEQYLDNINAATGAQALQKKYTDALNKVTRVQDQRRIASLMEEELENLKQRDRLTQYDLDRAEKKYNLMLAQIALEDAQQNKNKMRLRRDTQGNYRYEYVSDAAAEEDAENALNNAYTDLYNFDKARYLDVLDQIYSAWDEYQQRMHEAALINDPELRAQKELLIQEQYGELINDLVNQNQEIRDNLQESSFLSLSNLYERNLLDFTNFTLDERDLIINELGSAFQHLTGFYNEDIANFKQLSEAKQSIIIEQLVPQWNSGVQQMAETFYGEDGFAKNTIDAWNSIKEAENVYSLDLEMLEDVSQQTFDTIANGEDESINKAEDLLEKNDELINAYDKELTAVQAVYQEVKKLREEYDALYVAATKAAQAAYEYKQKELEQQRQAAAAQQQTVNSAEDTLPTNVSATPSTNISTNSGPGNNGSVDIGEAISLKSGAKLSSSSYNRPNINPASWVKNSTLYVQMKVDESRAAPYHIGTSPTYSANTAVGWVNKDQITGYDTGGYTGNWGSNGRLAFLHEKELVLNSKDTENMLNAVSVMRSLAYSLGSSVLSRLAGVSASGYNGFDNSNGMLEQNVHIQADFPNVRDAREIEEALNNLVNVASQRIMEK